MKRNLLITHLVALAIALTAALLTQPTRAGAIDTLVITEESSTVLTASLTMNGTTTALSVSGLGDDRWDIALVGISGLGGIGFTQTWAEPDAAGFSNEVAFSSTLPDQLFVQSEFARSGNLADGTPDTSPLQTERGRA